MRRGPSASGPAALRRGDRVGVVSTGFAVRPDALDAGVAALAAMGFTPVVGPAAARVDGYFAGTDAERAADLNACLADPTIAGVWFARGGYGTARLYDRIDWRAVARRDRVWVGFSDLTALFAALVRHRGQVCLHGPLVAELGDAASFHEPSLLAMLRGKPVALRLTRDQVVAPGRASGRLIGGNLTVLSHLLGTRWFPDCRGAVLLLEDAGEEAYRLDRMLTHLRLAGVLGKVRAVLVGDLAVPATRRAYPPDKPVEAVVADRLGDLGIPVVRGLPIGHLPGKWTVPIGGRVSIDTSRRAVRFDRGAERA